MRGKEIPRPRVPRVRLSTLPDAPQPPFHGLDREYGVGNTVSHTARKSSSSEYRTNSEIPRA